MIFISIFIHLYFWQIWWSACYAGGTILSSKTLDINAKKRSYLFPLTFMLSVCPSPLRCRHQYRIKLVKISSCDKIDRKWRGDWKSWESYQITLQGCQRGEREGRLNGTWSRLRCNQHKEARLGVGVGIPISPPVGLTFISLLCSFASWKRPMRRSMALT